MSKYNFGDGQFVVYAKNEQEARQIISQELKRFDFIKQKMSKLLTENGEPWANFTTNLSEEKLNVHFNDAESAIYDRDPTAKGEVRLQRDSNNRTIRDENGFYKYELAYRYPEIDGHNANFRLAHEMGHLMLNAANPQRQVYNEESNSRHVSGLIRRDEETGQFYGEQMQENAINLIAQLAIRGNISADDIISGKVDLSEYNSYKRCDDLVKLLAVSMRNDFENEMTFEELVEKKIDSIITHKDGTQEPANTFFYGILNDSSLVENEFDKYLGKGTWRELNDAFEQLYDSNISNEKFELIFKNAKGLIQDFANARYQDKYKEAVARNGNTAIPSLENKLQMLNEVIGEPEILTPINPEKNENKLSLRQKIARFLQKNNLFMNLPFVKKFVHKEMYILPEHTESRNIITVSSNKSREDFLNSLTNFGQYRNLPPIQRMSDSQKIEEIKRKMDQKQQANTPNER